MLFSVIVPVYCVEKLLPRCVESILAQTCGAFELILVDDGSPDGCGALCDDFARKDRRVRVIHKPNGGPVSARNAGLFRACGEYVCYVDGDDWVVPLWLETIRTQIERAPQRPDMVAFGATEVYSGRTRTVSYRLADGFYDKARMRAEIYPYLLNNRRRGAWFGIIGVTAWSKAYRRELLLAHYCRDEQITLGEDTAFTIECALCAQSICVCNEALYCYNRENADSMMAAYNPERFRAYERLFRYLRERLGGKDPSLDAQLNEHCANVIATGVFHEAEFGRTMRQAARRIAEELCQTELMQFVTIKGLPLHDGVFMLWLKLHLYRTALLGAKAWKRLRE